MISDDELDEEVKRRRRKTLLDAVTRAAGSAGVTGGLMGAGGSILSGVRSLKGIGKSAAVGALLSAAMAGGSQAIGGTVLGNPPDDDDTTGYTKRGAVGGALMGGLVGAAGGHLAGSGKIASLMESYPKLAKTAEKVLPLDNLVVDHIKKFAKNPSGKNAKIGAYIGGGVLGTIGAYHGGDEGMQLDTLNNEMRKERQRQLLEAYGP